MIARRVPGVGATAEPRSTPVDEAGRHYFDAVLRSVRSPNAVHLYSAIDVGQVLQDDARFWRPLPATQASAQSLRMLSGWLVFRHDPARVHLRVLLSAALKEAMSTEVANSIDQQMQRIVGAHLGGGRVDANKLIAHALTHAIVVAVFGITPTYAPALHAASELIDAAANQSLPASALDGALTLFGDVATESPLFEAALRRAHAERLPLDSDTIRQNLGMLLYGFFGPLPAALTNLVLCLSLDDRWRTDGELDPLKWLQESLRLFSPTAAVDRVACSDAEVSGVSIRAGQLVRCVIPAANRDPSVFDRPDFFDIRRPYAGGHLALGRGIHACFALPMLELASACLFRHLTAHTTRILPQRAPIEWRASLNGMCPVSLEVAIEI